PQARFNRGLALLKAGRNTEASAVFRDLLGRNPRHADAHYYLGKSLVAQGSSREAGRHFREALALRPGDAGFLEGVDSLPEEETR
ncbi:MAG TPA: tetratricopeptide repeat protein, partial [Candidatus Deferrimicrobiaceae bacterium]